MIPRDFKRKHSETWMTACPRLWKNKTVPPRNYNDNYHYQPPLSNEKITTVLVINATITTTTDATAAHIED